MSAETPSEKHSRELKELRDALEKDIKDADDEQRKKEGK